MSPSPTARPEELEPPPSELVEAGIYPTAKEGFDHGLVVLAMGRPYWLVPGEAGHRLLVEPEKLSEVRAQLAQFDRESTRGPPAPAWDADAAARKIDLLMPFLWALAVVVAFQAQAEWPVLTSRFALDAAAVIAHGEWWRAGTALFLHGSADHLVSNGLSGIFVFAATCSAFGRKRGWSLLAAAAMLGNLAIATVHYPAVYRSLGASTAIFAGLGLLTGRAMRCVMRTGRSRRWQEWFLPLASGLTVLALYGAGGAQARGEVDVGAHAAGFIAGLGLGFVFFRQTAKPGALKEWKPE